MMVLPKSDTGMPLGAEVMVQARMQKQLALQGYYLLGCASKNCPAGEAQTSATNYRRELSVSGGHLRGL